jgi:hypothetical protein
MWTEPAVLVLIRAAVVLKGEWFGVIADHDESRQS